MRILSISNSDFKGGAAKVAYYLTKGMRARGVDADLFVVNKTKDESFIHELPIQQAERNSVYRRVFSKLGLNRLFAPPIIKDDFAKNGRIRDYDLVHFHDVPDFLPEWFSSHSKKPLVWTIHSMAPLTGGCIYPYECIRWTHKCGECPQFGKWPLVYSKKDKSSELLEAKRKFCRNTKFQAVGVSQWVTEQIARSVMSGQETHTVQNPCWSPDFYPIDKSTARSRLNVPQDAFAIVFSVSGKIEDTRKGLDIVCAAVRRLHMKSRISDRVFLMPMGIIEPTEELRTMLQNFNGLAPKHVTEIAELRDYYAAADILWHPSRADTSSMVCLESFGCGTPVIAAKVGGVPEIVEHGLSGLLVEPNDPHGLAAATKLLIESPSKLEMLQTGAMKKSKQHCPNRFIEGYFEVYQTALKNAEI